LKNKIINNNTLWSDATPNALGLAIKPKDIGSCWKSDPRVLGLAQNSYVCHLLDPTLKFKFLKNIFFYN
jgi:hypothetical protein